MDVAGGVPRTPESSGKRLSFFKTVTLRMVRVYDLIIDCYFEDAFISPLSKPV
jgi:hypothetical protein